MVNFTNRLKCRAPLYIACTVDAIASTLAYSNLHEIHNIDPGKVNIPYTWRFSLLKFLYSTKTTKNKKCFNNEYSTNSYGQGEAMV